MTGPGRDAGKREAAARPFGHKEIGRAMLLGPTRRRVWIAALVVTGLSVIGFWVWS